MAWDHIVYQDTSFREEDWSEAVLTACTFEGCVFTGGSFGGEPVGGVRFSGLPVSVYRRWGGGGGGVRFPQLCF